MADEFWQAEQGLWNSAHCTLDCNATSRALDPDVIDIAIDARLLQGTANAHLFVAVQRRQITVLYGFDNAPILRLGFDVAGDGMKHEGEGEWPVYEQVAMALDGAGILAVEVDEVGVERQRRVAEQQRARGRQCVREVWVPGCCGCQ